jgi:hypothetical protein
MNLNTAWPWAAHNHHHHHQITKSSHSINAITAWAEVLFLMMFGVARGFVG